MGRVTVADVNWMIMRSDGRACSIDATDDENALPATVSSASVPASIAVT